MDLTAAYPDYIDEAMAAIKRLIESSQFIGGEEIELFEKEFASFCGMPYAVGCSNGTDALVVALRALGGGPGDAVVTVPNTFIASAECINAVGADIEFVDIDPDRFTMDPKALERHLRTRSSQKKLKAVIPVHLYGQMADMPEIARIAKEYGLKIVEDSAQAHGAKLSKVGPGYYGDIATFSFYPGKNLGAFGDAGAIVTKDAGLHEMMKRYVNHGRWKEKYEHPIVGANARMDTIQAAILRIKLRHLPSWTTARRRAAASYSNGLSKKAVKVPFIAQDSEHAFHLFVVRSEERDDLQKRLNGSGIQTGVHYPIPLHLQKAYAYLGYGVGSFPEAEASAKEVLSLPIWPEISSDQLKYVCDAI